MAAEITHGAVRAILTEQVDRDTFHPVLQVSTPTVVVPLSSSHTPLAQVLDVRTLKGSDRYRLVCSDTVHYTQCMAASQLNKVRREPLPRPTPRLAAHRGRRTRLGQLDQV